MVTGEENAKRFKLTRRSTTLKHAPEVILQTWQFTRAA